MRIIAQNSAPDIMILMVQADDHVTGMTGLTPVVTISKSGGEFAAPDASATVTEVSSGWYRVHLTANDTGALGDLVVHATATGADPSDRLLFVQSTDVTGVNTAVAAVPANVWGSATRSLTTFGTLAADTATAVWSAGTRTLSSFGTLAADAATAVWGAATRTLSAFGFSVTASSVTDKTGYALTSAYDAAKTAASATAVAAIPTNPVLATDSRLGNLDAAVSSRLAASGLPVALPVMQGSVYTATAAQQRTVTIVQGDTPTITFDFGANYTAWAARFAAKVNPSDTAYAIAPKACTWIDATKGQGAVTLAAADTATAGKYSAEIELKNGSTVLTALKCKLEIIPEIVRAA